MLLSAALIAAMCLSAPAAAFAGETAETTTKEESTEKTTKEDSAEEKEAKDFKVGELTVKN